MSERYTRLFALPGNLYAEGSPVVLAAGALLKDNETGKVLAQLKIKNISSKTIKAAKVRVTPFDTVGNPLGEETDHQYLDLNIERDKEFGQKVAIELPDASTRSFSVAVTEVDFEDNSVWTPSGAEWEPLPKQTELTDWLNDAELEKQYQLEYGKDCKYALLEVKDLWLCPCGEINRQGQTICHLCDKSLPDLKAADLEKLKEDRDARLAAEKEEAEKEKAAAEIRAKKTRRLAMILVPIVVIITVAAVLISGAVKKSNAYNIALALLDTGKHEEAIAAFSELGDYKDSTKQIQFAETAMMEEQNAKAYAEAMELLKSGVSVKEDKAYYILKELGDYNDAHSLLASFVYKRIASDTSRHEYDTFGNLVEIDYGGYSYYYRYEDGRLIWEGISESDWATDKYTYYPNGSVKSCTRGVARMVSSGVVTIQTINYNKEGYPETVIFTEDNKPNEHVTWNLAYTLADNGSIAVLDCSVESYGSKEIVTKTFDFSDYDGFVSLEVVGDKSSPITIAFANTDRTCAGFYSVINLLNSIYMSKDGENVLEYDDRGRLISRTAAWSSNKFSYRYKYDDYGNLIEETSSGGGNSYTHAYTYGYIYAPDAP